MPWQDVMHKFKAGALHSGSKSGPPVKNRAQAIAIMLSEKRSDKDEYHRNAATRAALKSKVGHGR